MRQPPIRQAPAWQSPANTQWRGSSPAAARGYWFFINFLSSGETALATSLPVAATESQKMQVVEAVLFIARDSLSSRKLAQIAGLADATEARTLVRLLNRRYDSGGRVFRIEEVAGGFCLLTRPQFAPWLRRMRHVPGELRLTQSAMEALAIVAYRQPVPRADIEAIRGVSCGEILKQLMQRDLIRICGRSEDLGRPYLYGTTRFFLQMFGLRSADRLPRSEWINAPSDIATSNNVNMSQSSSEHDSGTGIDAKESTVRQSFSAATLLPHAASDQTDDIVLGAQVLRAVDDDDDEFFEEEDDDEDDDEDFDDEEDDDVEEDADDLEEDEAFEDEDEDEDDWEEVDDEEEEGDETEEWEDDEEEDWDDEEDDEEEAEEDEDEEWD